MRFTDEHRKKLSESAKKRCTSEWRKAKSDSYRTQIDDNLLKSLYESGKTQVECAREFGVSRKVIENAIKRLGIVTHRQVKRDQWGEKNTGWRGESASKLNKHRRLYRIFGQPKMCDVCGTSDPGRTYDWANLTGNYDDPNDYKRMCRSCHCKYDKKYLNFKGRAGKQSGKGEL